MKTLPTGLAALAAYRQFIIYKTQKRDGSIKLDKIPVNYRTAATANAHDPAVWLSASEAISIAELFGPQFGVGFVFTENDPFFVIDIDDCLIKEKAQWTPEALAIMQAFSGAYQEISLSGEGIHIIGTGTPPHHTNKNSQHKLELYTHKRFIALTGISAVGDARTDCSAALPVLVDTYFKPVSTEENISMTGWTTQPCAAWSGPEDDDELIKLALNARSSAASIFGDGVTFAELWEADTEALARKWPANDSASHYDASSADMSLAQRLAFWTGNNCERILRLMYKSKLAREKWEREDYLTVYTIPRACARQREFYNDKRNNTRGFISDEPTRGFISDEPNPNNPIPVTGSRLVTPDEQKAVFKNCVYVMETNQILIPGGYLVDQQRFKAIFGGRSYVMDHQNQRVCRNAWEAFTESQAYDWPKVATHCFKPQEAPGAILNVEGEYCVNTWWPIHIAREAGDAAPFLNHLAKVLPNEHDRQVLLSYMAAVVQYQGVKFRFAPFLQGTEGNGKTLFMQCLARAIGNKYVHFASAQDLTNPFNSFYYGKILIGVEEIKARERIEIMESLKDKITNTYFEIQPKFGEKRTREICCNFIFSSNHKDGILKSSGDRRYSPLFSAQQTPEDLKRDGLTLEYFLNLTNWLNKRNGFAIVADYLHTYKIPDDYNPTLLDRAPITTATAEAIKESVGTYEQEILEAIAQGQIGFRGGWVSSIFVDRLLNQLGIARKLSYQRRKALLVSLGYEWHPALHEGRVNNLVLPDGGKPRLYIHSTSAHRKLNDPVAVVAAYTAAQQQEGA